MPLRSDDEKERDYQIFEKLMTGELQGDDAMEAIKENQDPNLLGREPARKVVKENKITDPDEVALVRAQALPFHHFQQMNLFHPNGFFPQFVDYQKAMPMCPQILSPLFGHVCTELLFGGYMQGSHPFPKDPTFLSLGAGRGYMDHDIIDFITGPRFMRDPEWGSYYDRFRDHSRFIITDHTDRSFRYLREQLDPLLAERGMRDRVEIRKLDALDFQIRGGTSG